MEYKMLALHIPNLSFMVRYYGRAIRTKTYCFLPRETVRAYLPNSLKTYPKATVIIDYTESFTQRFKHL